MALKEALEVERTHASQEHFERGVGRANHRVVVNDLKLQTEAAEIYTKEEVEEVNERSEKLRSELREVLFSQHSMNDVWLQMCAVARVPYNIEHVPESAKVYLLEESAEVPQSSLATMRNECAQAHAANVTAAALGPHIPAAASLDIVVPPRRLAPSPSPPSGVAAESQS